FYFTVPENYDRKIDKHKNQKLKSTCQLGNSFFRQYQNKNKDKYCSKHNGLNRRPSLSNFRKARWKKLVPTHSKRIPGCRKHTGISGRSKCCHGSTCHKV